MAGTNNKETKHQRRGVDAFNRWILRGQQEAAFGTFENSVKGSPCEKQAVCGSHQCWKSQMRPPLFSIAIALILVLSGCSRNTDSLSFQLPPGWKLERHTAGGRNFYMAGANTPGEGSFMLSPWLQPTKPEEIPTAVQGIADSFSKQAPLSGIVLARRDYRVENFNGTEGPGSYAVFQISYGGKNSIQAMFMLGVSNRVWYGQFIGSSNFWPQALTILKSARKDRQP